MNYDNASNRRKNYMRGQYSKYWSKARKNVYGTMDYDLRLIDLVDQTLGKETNQSILDVGVGTGWPIATSLSNMGYNVSGIDISSDLVDQCKKDYPEIQAIVGDAENLSYDSGTFDLVYCFHSSFFLPDLLKALSEMARATKENGFILIDIMNKYNPNIYKINQQHFFENSTFVGKFFKTVKNLAKFILRSGTQDWPYLISWSPSDPNEIIDKLLSFGGEVQLYSLFDKTPIQLPISTGDTYRDHGRIVVSCKI